MWIEFAVLLVATGYLFYRWSTCNYDYFKKRGIWYHKPMPLLGSMAPLIFRRRAMMDLIKDLYNLNDGKYFGVFDQRVPVLLIRDPELLKQITVKDFDHFVNHRPFVADDANLFSNSLFLMQDSKWRDMRSTLSPAFTGSKMRHMFRLINQVAQDAVTCIQLDQKSDSASLELELDLKNFCTRFSNDVIASTAFGIQVNSFKDEKNKFYQMGKKVTNFTALQNLKFFIFQNFPSLIKILKIDLFDKDSSDYFMHLVIDAMKYRKEYNISRPDMINLLMEARGMIKTEQPKTHSRDWTDVEIVAQCFLFFFAGFETTAVLMCLIAHELMENSDIQQILFEEIELVNQGLNGTALTYEVLQSMTYMDMVVSETLRKWPPAVLMDRVCSKDITYEIDGNRLEIKKGDLIWIPAAGIHYDPINYENPNKFDPQRFNSINKDTIKPFTYMPFGVGPRNCIGSRFALLEAKAIIFYILTNFRIEPSAKSTIPLELSPKNFQITPKTGYWMKFVPRQ